MSQDRILELLMKKDEITWQTIILDLVNSNEINPWDVDISILTQKYIEIVKKMQESNLFISGKVLLASAILLKIKSERLIEEDIGALDNLMFPSEMESLDQFLDPQSRRIILDVEPKLTIKTPQARKRRVNMEDLISALEKALEVNERRLLRIADRNSVPENLIIPEKPRDITEIIEEIFQKITKIAKELKITFSELIPSQEKKDKIYAFVPLLHLSNQDRVDLDQFEHFGEIHITIKNKNI
jgi:segregation and condensation protein A